MALNYGVLKPGATADTVADPQKLFQALPARAKKYGYLRDVQGEVLAQWFEAPDRRDVVLKMNTGGGKTVVGLLILKSCLNAKVGPAVYVAPDHYLCSQVVQEAKDLGLATTDDPRSLEFQTGKAILVIPIHTLVNGRSRFGVGQEIKRDIGSIIVDDAHACLATTEKQFTLSFSRDHAAYGKLYQIFREDLRKQSLLGATEIERADPRAPLLQIPYWAWAEKQERIISAIAPHQDEDEVQFIWPLLKGDLQFCRCFITTTRVEISMRCLPIDVIPSFVNARRRIYMTATLADDAVLVTNFGANPEAISKPILPKTASDLGERMIFVPQEVDPKVTDEQIKAFAAKYKRKHNVVVIVPSIYRANFWADVATPGLTLTADNIEAGVDKLRKTTGNLAVLVNKYDGVDLPNDACRLLIVDGVPDPRHLIDRYEQAALRSSDRLNMRQVQRIEQGMGRGIRSNDDYCGVLLMGSRLLSALYGAGAAQYFSSGTGAQVGLSRQLSGQIGVRGLDALDEPIADMLARNPDWVAAAKNTLIEVANPKEIRVDAIAIAQRAAFEACRRGQYEEAETALREAERATEDRLVKGWLLEQVAAVVFHIDKERSQQVLAAANEKNSIVTKPLAGIAYRRIDGAAVDQAIQAQAFLKGKYPRGGNSVLLGINGLLANLVFGGNFDEFEQSLMELGQHLGFQAHRPEKDGTWPLDVLWATGNREYLLFSCKNEAASPAIPKRYTDEVGGSVNWFNEAYDNSCRPIPVIIHPADVLDKLAAPPQGMRVISVKELDALRAACEKFATAVKDHLDDATHIRASLGANGLLGAQVVGRHTAMPKQTP
jgi:hypothetical protein